MFKLRIPLDSEDMPVAGEIVWAEEVSSDTCRICSVPAYAMEIAEGDIVRYTQQGAIATFAEVVTHSGNGVVRVYFHVDAEESERAGVLAELKQFGWTYEAATENLYLFSCPNRGEDELEAASDLLNEHDSVEAWEFGKLPVARD